MKASRTPLIVTILVGLSWWGLVLLEPRGPRDEAKIGFLLGTLFGQTTLAAAWAAFGPLAWYARLPLAGGWLALLWLAMALNVSIHNGPGPGEFLIVLAACLLGQWLLVQVPLWGLAWAYDLRVAQRLETPLTGSQRTLQFGIRQLMTLTAVVASILGAGRAVIPLLAKSFQNWGGGEGVIFAFLAIAAVVMTLPLVMAALLPRVAAVVASLSVLLLIALATSWELPLLQLVSTRTGPGPLDFIFINAFTAAWILVLIGVVRLGGYSLVAEGAR